MTTIVHLLRHGEVHNPEGILYGRLPGYHLSEAGRTMADTVAEKIKDRDVTYLVASPLDRAQETAAPLAAVFGLEIHTDDRLIESDNWFEGKKFGVGDGALRHPKTWAKVRNPFKPSWGEAYLDIAHRMVAAVIDAKKEAEGHEAVLVSHQLPIWIARRYLQKQKLWHDPRKRECGLASLTSLVYEGPALVRIDYSEPAGPTAKDAVPGA